MFDTKRSWHYLDIQPSNVLPVGRVILNNALFSSNDEWF